ncbi:MAG: hypothetical protein ACMXYG_03325 [Candidatus Woesearchaeota archaeon]
MPIAYTEPTEARKRFILSHMHQVDSLDDSQREEFEEIVRNIRLELDTRIRSKTTHLGYNGQNHYLGIRALNDPRETDRGQEQLAGEEFFGVNRFVDELLDVADVQWWTIYANAGWGLHERSTEGEHLECWGSWGDLKSALIVVDGVPLSIDQTVSFYRTLMNRQRKGFSQRYKRDEVQSGLEKIASGKRLDDDSLDVLERLGLIENGEVTYKGRSLVTEQKAVTRKDISEKLAFALDHHGLGKDEQLGPYGKLYSIAQYLQDSGIKDLLDKGIIDEEEFQILQKQDEAFVKLFGFSFIQEALVMQVKKEDIANPFTRELARDMLPAYGKLTNIEQIVIEQLKSKDSNYRSRIESAIKGVIDNQVFEELNEGIKCIKEGTNTSESSLNWFVDRQISRSLKERAEIAQKSNSIDDRYGFFYLANTFKQVRYKQSELTDIALDSFELIKKDYLTQDFDGKIKSIERLKQSFMSKHIDDILISDMICQKVRTKEDLEEAINISRHTDINIEDNIKKYLSNISGTENEIIREILSHVDLIGVSRISHLLPDIVNEYGGIGMVQFFSEMDTLDTFIEQTNLIGFEVAALNTFSEKYASLDFIERKSAIKTIKSLKVAKDKELADIVFDNANDAQTLDEAIRIAKDTSIDYNNKVKGYLRKLTWGKAICDKIKALAPYQDVIKSHSLSSFVPKSIASLGDPDSILWLGSVFPNHIQLIIDKYMDFKQDVESLVTPGITKKVLYVKMPSIDEDTLSKLNQRTGFEAEMEEGWLKFTPKAYSGMTINNAFLQVALFAAHVLNDVEYKPDEDRYRVVDLSRVKYLFGDAKPRPAIKYEDNTFFSNNTSLFDMVASAKSRRKKDEFEKYSIDSGPIEQLINLYSINEINKKDKNIINTIDKYDNFSKYIKY